MGTSTLQACCDGDDMGAKSLAILQCMFKDGAAYYDVLIRYRWSLFPPEWSRITAAHETVAGAPTIRSINATTGYCDIPSSLDSIEHRSERCAAVVA